MNFNLYFLLFYTLLLAIFYQELPYLWFLDHTNYMQNNLYFRWKIQSSKPPFLLVFFSQDYSRHPARYIPSLRRGLGRPLFPPFFFSFGLGDALLSFFKYFRPLPHLLSNIENMSTLFSVKIPLFCPSLQQLMLLSTNSLLFISSLLYPLIPSCSPSSYVYSLPVSPDHYAFL